MGLPAPKIYPKRRYAPIKTPFRPVPIIQYKHLVKTRQEGAAQQELEWEQRNDEEGGNLLSE